MCHSSTDWDADAWLSSTDPHGHTDLQTVGFRLGVLQVNGGPPPAVNTHPKTQTGAVHCLQLSHPYTYTAPQHPTLP